jgi:hypothetical protein
LGGNGRGNAIPLLIGGFQHLGEQDLPLAVPGGLQQLADVIIKDCRDGDPQPELA